TVTPTPLPTPSTTAQAGATPAVTSSTTTSAGTCTASMLALKVTTDQASYPAGSSVALTFTVRNTSHTSCRRDLGQAGLGLRILSGSDRIWSSNDCAPGGSSDVVTLRPGAQRAFPVRWGGKRSKPGCPAGQPT